MVDKVEIVEALEQLSNSNKGFRKKAFENCLKIISSENISSVEDLAKQDLLLKRCGGVG